MQIDSVKFAADLESYEDLKSRIVRDTAAFGAVGAATTLAVRCGGKAEHQERFLSGPHVLV